MQSANGRHLQIVWPVGNEFVAKGFFYFVIHDQKCARHSFHIPRRRSRPVPLKPGDQHAQNAFVIEILMPFRVRQPERLVELAGWVANSRHIFQLMLAKKLPRLFVAVCKVYECQPRAICLDCFSKFAQLGDRLAAKRSTKMPQKYQQHRLSGGQTFQRLAILRLIFVYQLRVDRLGGHFNCSLSFRRSSSICAVAPGAYFCMYFFTETLRAVFSELM